MSKTAFRAVIAILLVIVLGVGAMVGGYFMFGTINVKHWFKDKPAAVLPDNSGNNGDNIGGSDIEGVGNNMIINSGEEYGISLTSELIAPDDYDNYGISTQAETAYTFVGTAYDENGSSNGVPQDMEGSASWKNASSSWASGKNVEQYIKVTKTGDNQFQVSCLQEFGEPAILTIKSAHSTASATKQFDYVKRVLDVYLKPTGRLITFDNSIQLEPEINYGVGTVEGDVYFRSFGYELSTAFVQALNNSTYYSYFLQQANNSGITADWDAIFSENFSDGRKLEYDEEEGCLTVEAYPSIEGMFLANMAQSEVNRLSTATNGFKYFNYAMIDALNHLSNKKQVEFSVTWYYAYGGVQYSYGSSVEGYVYDTLVFGTLPKITSVTISGNSNYVF